MKTVLHIALIAIGLNLAHVHAQEPQQPAPKPPPLKIESVRVGFNPYDPVGRPHYKAGMWTPVYVKMVAGEKPIVGNLILETIDNDDVGTTTTMPVALDAGERRIFIAYVRPGNISAEIKVSVETADRTFNVTPAGGSSLELHMQLFLTLGARMADMQTTLQKMTNQPRQADDDMRSTAPRFAGFEGDASLLPDQWLGYHGVDLIFLSTDRKEFLEALLRQGETSRLRALAQWVRRGGHLVVPVNWLNQGETSRLLQHHVWQPPIPAPIPEDAGDVKANAPTQIHFVDISVGNRPFNDPQNKGFLLAQLQLPNTPAPDWHVHATTGAKHGHRPVIVRMPYGMGSITLLAFSLEQPPFSLWDGRVELLKGLISQIAPRAPQLQPHEMVGGGFGRGEQRSDLTSEIYNQLDNFDVKVVPFGWVALFILLYILVVGPLDYLLLKYVFQRLEWTWITFPTVVLAVSVAAYFTAYAIKGKDLKVNQVDVVTFDLRTQLDDKKTPKKAYAYGQSFFTLLSPRIQNYTIGMEPNPAFWGQSSKTPLSADMVSWFGRSQQEWNGMGRRGSQSFFRKPYSYVLDESGAPAGLKGVPIPVWTTKSFMALWEAPLPALPFQIDLTYNQSPNLSHKISGKMQNNLAVDLEDVWVFYLDRAYRAKNLPGKKAGEVEVKLEPFHGKDAPAWGETPDDIDNTGRPSPEKGTYRPTREIKQMLFFGIYENSMEKIRNHALRAADQSWRLRPEPSDKGTADTSLREAVVYARVKFRSGAGDTLADDTTHPLPVRLWLGDVPGQGKTRPSMSGTLNQDTYIRVIVPIRPAGK